MRDDLRAFKLIKGVARIPETYKGKGSDGKSRHADAGIALVLAYYASQQPIECFAYTRVPLRARPAATATAGTLTPPSAAAGDATATPIPTVVLLGVTMEATSADTSPTPGAGSSSPAAQPTSTPTPAPFGGGGEEAGGGSPETPAAVAPLQGYPPEATLPPSDYPVPPADTPVLPTVGAATSTPIGGATPSLPGTCLLYTSDAADE